MRASTLGLGLNLPTLSLSRYGAVDQRLTSDVTRVKPLPPAGILYGRGSPVRGWCTVIVPTEGKALYDREEKLSQMLSSMALVASGLQALVSSSVTGTRTSVERKLFSRKSSANTIVFISRLNSSVLVQSQYFFQQSRYPGPAQP